MKMAAKVFLIIGMVFTFYLIFPIIVGVNAINRLNTAKTVEDLKGYGIASILCVSVLGGIFMLFVRQEELDDNNYVQLASECYHDENSCDPSERLLELKFLLDDGIISKEIYEEKRKKYLEKL